MKKVMPQFKDEKDKLIIVAMIIASIFFSFLPALAVVFFLKDYISESSNAVAKMFFNFELLLFLVALIFIIPIIGQLIGLLAGPIMMILNVVICIINLCAIGKGSEVKVPVPYEFL
jgi:hypothetical protein